MKTRALVACIAFGALLAACSKQETPSIFGHWQAERATVFSAHLPVGPDIMISDHAISMPRTDASIPLTGITQKKDEAVLEMPLGVGLSFYFDDADRVHLNVPLLGKIYYRRVHDAASAQVASATGAATTTQRSGGTVLPSAVVQSSAAVVPAVPVKQAASAPGPTIQGTPTAGSQGTSAIEMTAAPVATPNVALSPASPEFERAVLAARNGDQDLAIAQLREAFQHGFKRFDAIDTTPEFASLRSDVRFQALVARYR